MRTIAWLFAFAMPLPVSGDRPPERAVTFDQSRREVVGWTEEGGDLVVDFAGRGERIVESRGRDFYVELREIRAPDSGALLRRYRLGQPSGVSHPIYEDANPAEEGRAYVEGRGLTRAEQSWSAPSGSAALTTLGRTTIEPRRHDRRGRQFVCLVRYAVVLLDAERNEAGVVEEWTDRGRPASRREDVVCPRPSALAWWHPEGERWAVVRRLRLSGEQVGLPQVVAGRMGGGSSGDRQPLRRTRRPLANWIEELESPRARRALGATLDGEYDRALEMIEASDGSDATEPLVAAIRAFALALADQTSAARGALPAAGRAGGAGSRAALLRSATLGVLGDGPPPDEVATSLEEAVDSVRPLIAAAELFRYVDVRVSNQLLLRSLEGVDSRSEEAYRYAYRLLARGLIEAGLYAQAEILFDKLDSPSPPMRALSMKLALERGTTGRPPEAKVERSAARLVREHPGLCAAHRIYGRVLARRGELGAAARQLGAARVCAPDHPATTYYEGAVAFRRGEWSSARTALERYLALAIPRAGDDRRATRRALAGRFLDRTEHDGAVLLSVRCEPAGGVGVDCSGLVQNTADEVLAGALVRALASKEADEVLARDRTGRISPGGTRSFAFEVSGADLRNLQIDVGRSSRERRINRTPAVVR